MEAGTTINTIQMKQLYFVRKQYKNINTLMHSSLLLQKRFKSQNENQTDTITN
jgi:hypothetical protein